MTEHATAQVFDVLGAFLQVGIGNLPHARRDFGKGSIGGGRRRAASPDTLLDLFEQDRVVQEQQVRSKDQRLFFTQLARSRRLQAQEVVFSLLHCVTYPVAFA